MPTPAPGRRTPLNTYRLQLHAGFTFTDAAARLDYLQELGITDLYLSPILAAVPGSGHGYDVVDPTQISEERGGRSGFEALANAAHARGLGIIVDIVPNHMAIPEPLTLNPPLWSALRDGPDSPYADWFDIELGAALVLPIVQLDGDGDPIPTLIADRRLAFGTLDRPGAAPEKVITLDGNPFPLASGTQELPLAEAVRTQRYSLQRWQGNHTRLTHRRFFDIVSLIGIRQESPEVFQATHTLLFELYRTGHIDSFRVDHPDGLADPQGYFEQLAEATGGAWVAAEKILTGDELLPTAWPVAGTTGYEAAWRFDAVQLDSGAARPLAELAQRTDSDSAAPLATWPEVAHTAKRFLADTSLAIDVDRLIRLAARVHPKAPEGDLRAAIRELLVAMDRYRAYVRPGRTPDGEDARVLRDAAAWAAAELPDRLGPVVDWLHALAAGEIPDQVRDDEERAWEDEEQARVDGGGNAAAGEIPEQVRDHEVRAQSDEAEGRDVDAAREFVVRFQQVTGALVAKGVEDTAFYRWTQLLTLCDVGADPDTFGLTPDQLHDWLGRINAGWPATMSLGSTHDSKRSEDVRARIAAISEYPAEWADLITRLNPLAASLPAPIRSTLWQTLAGTWTTDGPISADRLAQYLVKAGREQKLWTSWVEPDHGAEEIVAGAVPEILGNPAVRRAFTDWVDLVADSVSTNTLSTKLVQLTALGVADVYQGQETLRLSLTDPDNRRPVDFGALAAQLAGLSDPRGREERASHEGGFEGETATQRAGEIPGQARDDDGPGRTDLSLVKLLLTTTALLLRRRHPEAFAGPAAAFRPLHSTTEFAWGFARGETPHAVTIATRLTRARLLAGGWQDADLVHLPRGRWRNLLTGTSHTREFRFATGLGDWPCALLERIG